MCLEFLKEVFIIFGKGPLYLYNRILPKVFPKFARFKIMFYISMQSLKPPKENFRKCVQNIKQFFLCKFLNIVITEDAVNTNV